MSEEHDANETAGSNETVNRRRILKGLGTAGGVATFGPMSISSASAEKIEEAAAEIDISDLRGAERKKAISRVVSGDEYKQLKSQYTDSGWRPDVRNATLPSHKHRRKPILV